MKKLVIAGISQGLIDYLPSKTLDLIKTEEVFIMQSDDLAIVNYLKENNKQVYILDNNCDGAIDLCEQNDQIAQRIFYICNKNGQAVLLTLGQGAIDYSAFNSIEQMCKTNNIVLSVLPGTTLAGSAISALSEAGFWFDSKGIHSYSSSDFKEITYDSRYTNIYTEVSTAQKAKELKTELLRHCLGECLVYVVKWDNDAIIDKIKLCDIDKMERYTKSTCIILEPVPFSELKVYDMPEFMHIIEILRAPDGCPWDRAQTHETLRRSLIEECYEVLDAIEQNDNEKICEELGDVMLILALHAQIAKENNEFAMLEIIDGISKKIVSRHTHVFAGVIATTLDEINKNWEEIKKIEKSYKSNTEVLKSVPKQFPALIRSEKVQKKASKLNFGCVDANQAYVKTEEELVKLKNMLKNGTKDQIEQAFGELLLGTVSLAMHSGIDSEEALSQATDKFILNFEKNEKN